MKKEQYIFLWGICIITSMLILSGRMAYAKSHLTVDFHYRGKSYSISGEQLNDYTYIFNQGALKKIKITTLDWEPYIGKSICKQGWVQQLTIAILASQGYEIVCTYYPWARTIATAESGNADILYPEYFIEPDAPSDIYEDTKRLDHLAISEKIPGGPVAFIKRKGEKDNYNGKLLNLKDAVIGVVRGYQNTPEFDRLMDQNFFNIDEATDDLTNIKMLVAKRVDMIIGDPSVIYFSVANSDWPADEKKNILSHIETIKPAIQYNHLYYAVSKKRPEWRQTLEMLNRTIDEFKKSGELSHIIEMTNSNCGFMTETLPEPITAIIK
jgi:polar amino acid transport system substrate-binding protein